MNEITVIDNGFSLEPKSLEEAIKFAEIMSKSSVVPLRYKDKPGDILISVQMGREVGLKPLQSLQAIAVINGTPSLYGDGALSVVQSSGLLEDFAERDPAEALKVNAGWCKAVRKGQATPIERTFSIEDAKKAGLWDKVGPWKQYPGRMLQMRARSWVLRDGFADALKGLQVAEEVQDYEPLHTSKPMLPPPAMPGRLTDVTQTVTPTPATSTAQPTTQANKPIPADAITGLIKVQDALSKVGNTNGKDWKKYNIVSEDGTLYGTFDEKLYIAALEIKELGGAAQVTFQKSGKWNNLLAITPYQEEPQQVA